MFRRHHLSVVGVIEHHLHAHDEVASAQHLWLRHGYHFVVNVSCEQQSGVGLLHVRPWPFEPSFSVSLPGFLLLYNATLTISGWHLWRAIFIIVPMSGELSGNS